MSLNGNLLIPDEGYITSDISYGTINVGGPNQILNIFSKTNFIQDINSVSVSNLKVHNIKSYSNDGGDPYDIDMNINIAGYQVNIGTNDDIPNNIINIGNTNMKENTINIGNPLSSVNINGLLTFSYFEIVREKLEEPILEINKGWEKYPSMPNMRGNNAGIQIDCSGGNGYIKTNCDGTRFVIKAPQDPNWGYIAIFDPSDNMKIKGNLVVDNILTIKGISDVGTSINNKVDISTLDLYYTKSYINNQHFLNITTASALFAPITSTSIFTTITVQGTSMLYGDVTMQSNLMLSDDLSVIGDTKLKGALSIKGPMISCGGIKSLGNNLFTNTLSLGKIPDVEASINSKANKTDLNPYLKIADASNTYLTIADYNRSNINGYNIMNFNIIKNKDELNAMQWINGFIGIPQSSDFTFTLPSASDIINNYFKGDIIHGACFNTYITYQLGTGRNNVYIHSKNISSMTYFYDGFGYNDPVTNTLQIKIEQAYAPVFKSYNTHFITRIDNNTTISIFKL
jgi:hypothetical protein